MKTAFCSLFLTGLLIAPMAQATVFKCKNSKGEVTYQSAACNEGDSAETIKIIGAPISQAAVKPEHESDYKKKLPKKAQRPTPLNRTEQQAQNDEYQ